MSGDEIFDWLTEHDISEPNARDMIRQATRRGSSYTLNGVFITYDGRIFNNYVA